MSEDPMDSSREKLLAYLYGELPQEERRDLEARLQSEPALRQALEEERKTLHLLDQIQTPEPRGDFLQRAIQIVRGADGSRAGQPKPDMRHGSAAVLNLRIRTSAGERTMEIHAEETPADLGRSRSCKVFVDDRGCSRRHARIIFSDGRFLLSDLSSANGTLLNDQPARQSALALNEGDRIVLGGVQIEVSLPQTAPPARLLLQEGGSSVQYEIAGVEHVEIGRSKTCGIQLSNPVCSRRQAVLRLTSKGLLLKDLAGRNSTLLNGKSVQEALLAEGDVLGFGSSTLSVLPSLAAAGTPDAEVLVFRRFRRNRQPESSSMAPLMVGLGLCAAAVMAVVALASNAQPPGRPAPREQEPTVVASREAEAVARQRMSALAALRADRDGPPEKLEDLRTRCWNLIHLFPDTPEAAEALQIARSTKARWERQQETRWEEARKAAGELNAAGELRQARAILAGAQDIGRHSAEAGLLLENLDQRIEREYAKAEEAAMAQARAGRAADALTTLEALKARYAGLPWGSAAQARISELGALERESRQQALAEQNLKRTEAESKRTEAESKLAEADRKAQRQLWTTNQARLAKMLSSSSWSSRQAAERQACFGAIVAVDPALSPPLMAALHKAHKDLLSKLKPKLAGKAVQEIKARLRGNLDERRQEALALIRDTVRYPYLMGQGNPYGPDGPAVQREVDELVAKVEEAYRPAQEVLKVIRETKGTGEVLADIQEVEGYLAQSGAPAAGEASLQGLLEKALSDAFDFAKETEALSVNADAMAQVAAEIKRLRASGALDAEEEDCILTTNRYRVMMGLSPLRIDPRLLAAARGHSNDMASRAYFAHSDPEGRGPDYRGRAAGFNGPLGENIYMGSDAGKAAFEGWKHSSGHHRNMLGASWTLIGVARNGNRWTMLLGS